MLALAFTVVTVLMVHLATAVAIAIAVVRRAKTWLCHAQGLRKCFCCAGTGCAGLVSVLSAGDISHASKTLAAATLKDFLLPALPLQACTITPMVSTKSG